MSKTKITIFLLIMLSVGIISLYSTFAYVETNVNESSESDISFIHNWKPNNNKEINVAAKEEKFVDIILTNTYSATIKYGMYYYMLNPSILPNGVTISLSEDTIDLLENTIKPNQTRTVSIRITNNSEYSISLIIGALIGFEKGDIEELITEGEILIK